jgi:hypothetical protein
VENLLNRLGVSVQHLQILDAVFRERSPLYKSIENDILSIIRNDESRILLELYAGGKKRKSRDDIGFYRQMVLADVIEYIFTGRIYYYAHGSEKHFTTFAKLLLKCANQLLIMDTVTVDPTIREAYIERLEETIPLDLLYGREGDKELARELKESDLVIWKEGWKKYDTFVDSLLPKTLGCPKELVAFLELVRRKVGTVIPLLLTQSVLADNEAIAPPDFLLLRENKEIFGVEIGYKKEGQCRKFELKTSIPTFAVDLADNLHNRCPKCGTVILYCDKVIEMYSNGSLWDKLDDTFKYRCNAHNCEKFEDGACSYSNYYGKYLGDCFYGPQKKEDKEKRHYHSKCVLGGEYNYYRKSRKIKDTHIDEFFAQIPRIEGLDIGLKE